MSAFLVSPKHIAALVTWANTRPQWGFTLNINVIVDVFVNENIASVEYRYPDMKGRACEEFCGMSLEEYTQECRKITHKCMSATQIIKLADSLEYQSCEHPGWENSIAKRYLDQIRATAISLLPGYEKAKWTIR